jgi:hypothetical protein
MAETITIRTGAATEVIKVIEQGPQGPVGPKGDPGDVAGLPLTTTGDTLYRAANSTNARLPIGTSGQVLKVVNGIPAWGNESGAVTSVNGQTGAVTVAALNHTHEAADVFFQGLELLDAGNANTNGVYVYSGVFGGKGIYYKDKDSFIYWDGAAWMVSYNSDDIYSSAQNTTTPWQVTSWSVEVGQTSPAPSSWDRLTGDQWEAVVGQRINPTLRGTAAGKNVGTGADDVAAGNDPRFSDSRQPTLHGSTHHTSGTDALAPSDIGAQSIFVTEALGTITSNVTLTAARAKIYTVTVNTFNTPTPNVQLPTTNVQAGDVVQIRFTTFTGREMPVRNGNGSFLGNSLTNGQRATYIAASTSNDSWAEDGTNRHAHTAADITSGTLDVARLPNHTHVVADVTGAAASGSITTSGLTQATARILGRTTASTGAVEEIAIGSGLSLAAGELSATATGGADSFSVKTTTYTAVNGDRIAANTTGGAFTITLPATPANGDTIYFLDYAGTFDTNNLTIARNGSNIESLAENMVCEVEDAAFLLVFVGSTVGWKVIPMQGTAIPSVRSDTTGITGATALDNIVTITQAAYNALPSYDSDTLYIISDAAL